MISLTIYKPFSRGRNVFILFLAFWTLSCTNTEKDFETAPVRELIAVEEVRIGKIDGDEEVVFGAINHISVGDEGQIYVSDRQVPIIRMYDNEGNFLGNIGREGRGPGEYLRVMGMKPYLNDQLAVWDIAQLPQNGVGLAT